MANKMVRINTTVSRKIFSEKVIKKAMTNIFDEEMSHLFEERKNEIKAYLDKEVSKRIPDSVIKLEFLRLFEEKILTIAVKNTISDPGLRDIRVSMLKVLTKENLQKAIIGETMIEAFQESILSLSDCPMFKKATNAVIIEMRKHFLFTSRKRQL